MSPDSVEDSRMAAALAAIAAYLDAERVRPHAVPQNRWSLAGRLDAHSGGGLLDGFTTGWGRTHVR